jgi:hypothetical protein
LARWRRKLKRLLVGLIGLVAVGVALVLVALAELDARPIKGWLRSLAASHGVGLDYARGRVTIGGVRFADIRIASPAVDAAVAPDLISIGAIEGRWSPLSRRLDELVIRDVALTVVRDADGTTSLDRWLAGLPASTPSTEPSDPLSALAGSLVPAGVEAHVRIEGVTIAVIERARGAGGVADRGAGRVAGDAPPRRITLTGLTARADVVAGGVALRLGPGALRLVIAPGAMPAMVERAPGSAPVAEGAKELVVELRGQAKLARAGHGSVELEAVMQRQSLAPALPAIRQLVSLAATVEFEPAERRTALRIDRLQLLDGAATLTASARAEDIATGGDPGIRPVVEQLALRLDLPAIARAVPAELGPIEAEGEPIAVALSNVALAPSPQGTLTASGRLVRARWRDIALRELKLGAEAQPVGTSGARGELRLAVAELELPGVSVRDIDAGFGVEHPERAASSPDRPTGPPARSTTPAQKPPPVPPSPAAAGGAAPGPWPLSVTGRASIGAIDAPDARVRGVSLTMHATARSARALDGAIAADLASLVTGPPSRAGAAVQRVHVEATVRDAVLAEPLAASTGVVELRAAIASARDALGRRAHTLTLTLDAAAAAGAPARARVVLDAGGLVVPGLGAQLGPAFAGGAAHAELEASPIELVAGDPARSRGTARLAARYGGATLDATANGSVDELSWQVTARAPRLGPSQGVALSSRGSIRPADVRIDHDSELVVGPTATGAAALRGARIRVVSHGTLRQHDAAISVALDAPSSGGRALRSARFDLAAAFDLGRGSAEFHLQGIEPAADLRASAALDPARAIHWQVKGRLAGLGAAAVVLPAGPDWSRLAIELDASGVASGIVAGVTDGLPVLVADPVTRLRGHQSIAVTLRELHYADAALTRADLDAATLKAELELGPTRSAAVSLDVPALAAVSSGVKLGAKALAVRLDATLGGHGVARGIDAKLTLRAASATQSAAPWYAIADPSLELTVGGDPDATLAVALRLANPGGGTAFELAGDVERGHIAPTAGVVARNSLTLDGKLEQQLDRLDAVPGKLIARGAVRVPFRIESGDLSLFRTTARVALDRVAVELPALQLRLTDITGELPIVQEIAVGPDGVGRIGQGERGPFSQLRFPDYRPFAGDADYLSIGEVSIRGRAFGPVAGNARIDHDVIALDQLELAALGGKITGQALAELRGVDSQLVFRGKVTGLRAPVPGSAGPGSADPLDANLAIALQPYRYGLEGRAEIVRIGRDHLRALLDVWDPFHADVAANRVRLALIAGYPKQVRLSFESGFAALAIELGGLAGAVRIDELRGLPIGPALAHWLAPILEP